MFSGLFSVVCILTICKSIHTNEEISNVIQENQLFIASRKANYQDATNLCRLNGLELVKVQNDATNDLVLRFANANRLGTYWMDGNDIQTEGKWVHNDGTSLRYTKWHPAQPDNWQNEDCLHGKFYDGGLWNDISCNSVHAVICYNKDGPIKPETINVIQESQLTIVSRSANYQTALDLCRVKGLNLVRVQNDATNDMVLRFANANRLGTYWMDGNDIQTEGNWVYADGTSLRYTKWHPAQPDNWQNEDCLHGLINDGGLWNDIPCNSANAVICYKKDVSVVIEEKGGQKTKEEVEIVVEKETVTKVVTRDLLVLEEKLTYEEALERCKSRGMKLVDVSNAEANKLTFKSASQVGAVPFWIDASDLKSEGVWVRSDGVKQDYMNFKTAEPNGERRENCAIAVDTGVWEDVACTTKNIAICYKQA